MESWGTGSKMDDFIVYMHINQINGKKYVGITHYSKNPNRRWSNGKGYFRNKHFTDAINRYGWENFKHIIIAEGLSKSAACDLERALIAKYNTQDKSCGYNITNGGEFFKHTDESKRLMSENRKGKGLHKFSEEHKRKMRENHAGGSDLKKVRCIETNQVFESINAAARYINKNKKMISNCCNNVPHYNTAGGYHWEFV